MTANQGFVKPTRRPGELGVHSLDHFHFVVPDLVVARTFYDEFGLDVGERGSRSLSQRKAIRTSGAQSERVRVRGTSTCRSAPSRTILVASQSACRRMASGASTRRPASNSNGLWFHDHDANLVEIAVAPKTSPNEKSQFVQSSAAPLARGAPNRTAVKRTHPRRLAHVLMFTTDVTKAIDFYSRVLGLRLSDHSGDGIAFMHGIHGSDHHMIALGKSSAPGLHHLSWDVGSVDEIGLGAMHMLGKGYDKGWGLGPSRSRVEFLPLRPRSVGFVCGIFRRHRLCASRCRLAGRGPSAGRFLLRLGTQPASRISYTTMKPEPGWRTGSVSSVRSLIANRRGRDYRERLIGDWRRRVEDGADTSPEFHPDILKPRRRKDSTHEQAQSHHHLRRHRRDPHARRCRRICR